MKIDELFPHLAGADARPEDWHALGQPRTTPFGTLQWLGAGVLGVTRDHGDVLVIVWLEATVPGRGDMGRYLDRLPRTRNIMVLDVINPVLSGMLHRRGFSTHGDAGHWARVAHL